MISKEFTLITGFVLLLLYMVTFLIFGEVTVRRLRKNSKLKDELGLELASGTDIWNVAFALSTPRKLIRGARRTRLRFLYPDVDLLYENTSLFDRVLARIHQTIALLVVIDLMVIGYLYT